MSKLYDVCALNDIPDQHARDFTLDAQGQALDLFIVRQGEDLYAYLNHCPHTGIDLNWQPDQFMDTSGKLIQCSNHGAQFHIHDGYCIRGPCLGASLIPVSLTLKDGRIKIRP